jgi:hypothetical protein
VGVLSGDLLVGDILEGTHVLSGEALRVVVFAPISVEII